MGPFHMCRKVKTQYLLGEEKLKKNMNIISLVQGFERMKSLMDSLMLEYDRDKRKTIIEYALENYIETNLILKNHDHSWKCKENCSGNQIKTREEMGLASQFLNIED